MRKLAFAALAAVLACAFAPSAFAWQTAFVVSSCGASSYSAGADSPLTMDLTGKMCTSGTGGGGGSSTATATASPPTYTEGSSSNLSQDLSGNLRVKDAALLSAVQGATPAGTNIIGQVGIDQTTPGTTNAVVPLGSAASGAANTSNPLKFGCVYLSTLNTQTTGNISDCMSSAKGRMLVAVGASGTATDGFSNTLMFGTGGEDTQNATRVYSAAGFLLNGSNLWDRSRGIGGAVAAGTGTAAVAIAPTNVSAAGVPISSTSALASNQVVCSAACNLYSFQISADSTLSAAAWWVMVFNATSAPADGAVTPAKCYAVPSGTTSFSAGWATPVRLGTGATIVASTTGCFSKTASVHAFISGDAQQ